jgi:hypothetical protein
VVVGVGRQECLRVPGVFLRVFPVRSVLGGPVVVGQESQWDVPVDAVYGGGRTGSEVDRVTHTSKWEMGSLLQFCVPFLLVSCCSSKGGKRKHLFDKCLSSSKDSKAKKTNHVF